MYIIDEKCNISVAWLLAKSDWKNRQLEIMSSFRPSVPYLGLLRPPLFRLSRIYYRIDQPPEPPKIRLCLVTDKLKNEYKWIINSRMHWNDDDIAYSTLEQYFTCRLLFGRTFLQHHSFYLYKIITFLTKN